MKQQIVNESGNCGFPFLFSLHAQYLISERYDCNRSTS